MQSLDLFQTLDTSEGEGNSNESEQRPLADLLRPKKLKDVLGQEHIVGDGGSLSRMIAAGRIGSIILWGPPGTGKTSIARLLSQHTGSRFVQISAIFSGVKDLKSIFQEAERQKSTGTLLFVDEIHRFNKAQLDSFLPHMEDGTIKLVGATTENPSFELNAALLSRAQVLVLRRLDNSALEELIERVESHYRRELPLDESAKESLVALADGDGRYLLNMLEDVFSFTDQNDTAINTEQLSEIVHKRLPIYDKSQDGHYNLISALHKSVRGSDVDATLYWLARMLSAGEQPMYLARRLVRMAVEDIGLADPNALTQTIAAKDAFELLGSPEGELALAQAAIYLSTAPKSNAGYKAYNNAMASARKTGSLNPPKHILNAPTKLMRDEGYGSGYAYDHDQPEAFSGQNYFPGEMRRENYYRPPERGFEREIKKRLDYWQKLRADRNKPEESDI